MRKMISIPVIILLFITTLGLGIDIAKHGQVKTKEYNGWASFISYIIIMGLYCWIGIF